MKKFFMIIGLSVLLLTTSPLNVVSQVVVDTIPPPAPTLQSPPNGDQLDTHNVRFQWNSVADPSGVTYRIVVFDMDHGITLHDVSGINGTSIDLLLYDAYYSWNVTATDGAGNVGPASGDWYLLVLEVDPMAPDTVVTAPNGGEVLEGGTDFAITWYALDQWTTSTPDLKVVIFFSRDNGANWEQIAQLQNNPGAFDWHVPNINCDETCLIRVTTENEAQKFGSDDSDFAFTIISSGPPTFADIPSTHFAFNQVEAIAAAGITEGCQADNPQTPMNEALFCPDAKITRGQMAAFIIRALGDPIGVLVTQPFPDVETDNIFCRYIEKLVARNITQGCASDDPATPVNEAKFCPEERVTREQMAAFLVRAKEGDPVGTCVVPPFLDVPTDNIFCKHIERLKTLGITAGFPDGTFRPSEFVPRDQMAVFLGRAFLGLL
jgi:hypothetical protein